LVFAAHVAVRVHVPVPLVIVTVAALIEQEPVAVMVGVIPEFEVATTVKVDWYGAVAGAPVMLAVCATLAAVVVCVTDLAK
jgi:hypothetical protein